MLIFFDILLEEKGADILSFKVALYIIKLLLEFAVAFFDFPYAHFLPPQTALLQKS